jgi:hypothetical protein
MALSILFLLGFFLSLDAVTEVRLSDNAEAHLQALIAAQSGLEHAGELLKGLDFDALLTGPDGGYDNSSAYTLQARTYGYRNPLAWVLSRSIDINNPGSFVVGMPDDGLINTGRSGTSPGITLIPLTGVAFLATRASEPGMFATARYFVKVSDNNGEASERALDPGDSPFRDGDGIVVIRSMGVAKTVRETVGLRTQDNSVAIFEARYKRSRAFDLDAPLVIAGNGVAPSGSEIFSGSEFRIDGGEKIGLAAIDTDASDGTSPASVLSSALRAEQYDTVKGAGLRPSIQDITGMIAADLDRVRLVNPDFLWQLANDILPRAADRVFPGNQTWLEGDLPDLGSYDATKAANDPAQKPSVTIVSGDLKIIGRFSGSGVLVVRGKLSGSGSLNYNGLILVLGAGNADLSGLELVLAGGLFMANLMPAGSGATFGNPSLSLGRNTSLVYSREALKMALRLIPASRIGWREITPTLDPP